MREKIKTLFCGGDAENHLKMKGQENRSFRFRTGRKVFFRRAAGLFLTSAAAFALIGGTGTAGRLSVVRADTIDWLLSQIETPITAEDEDSTLGMTLEAEDPRFDEPVGLSEILGGAGSESGQTKEDAALSNEDGSDGSENTPLLFLKEAAADYAEFTWRENTDAAPRKKTNKPAYGIDVSRWNGTDIDWDAVKKDGYTFVIVKIGGRYRALTGENSGKLYEDPNYQENIEGAKAAGLLVGAYYWCSAINETEAFEDAVYAVSLIRDYDLDLPLFYDYEWAQDGTYRLALPASVETRMAVCTTFMDTVQAYGYTSGVYSSDSWLIPTGARDNFGERTGLDGGTLGKDYRLWVARYSDESPGLYCSCTYDWWQFSSKGVVSGITYTDSAGNYRQLCDLNRWFSDGAFCGGSFRDLDGRVESEPMYRLYNPDTLEHLYTRDANEVRVLTQERGWDYEDIAWYAPVKSKTPVWRLFNKYSGEHLYTADANEYRIRAAEEAWNDEGICWYSDDGKGAPVYRMYMAGIPAIGSHHYTSDQHEYRVLISQRGWTDEGTAWYGLDEARRK